MLKDNYKIFIFGIIGGFLGGSIMLPFFIKFNLLGTANILNNLSKPTNNSVAQSQSLQTSEQFAKAINTLEPKVVGIQSFSDNTLVRYGSGMILTQDGLIATLNSVVPIGSKTIQILANDKIYSGAKVVFRNYNKNIAIVSVSGSDFEVASLKNDLPELAEEIIAFSRKAEFGKNLPLVNKATVMQVDSDNKQFKIGFNFDQAFYGATLADKDGRVIGLLDYRNQKPVVVFSEVINTNLNNYLTKAKK